MVNEIVSIIVPVYNCERYLSTCINSILRQSYGKIEIIIVDDGSTDNSYNICKDFASKDKRIRAYHTENNGVSSARNKGIDSSIGKYLMFVDADDYISEDTIENAVELMRAENSELCVMGINVLINENKIVQKYANIDRAVNEYVLGSIISGQKKAFIGRASWAKLYLKSVIVDNDIKFYTDQYIGEDAVFLLNYCSHIRNISVLNGCYYFYRINQGSLVTKYKYDLLGQQYIQLNYIKSILAEIDVSDDGFIKNQLVVFVLVAYGDLLINGWKGYLSKILDFAEIKHDASNWLENNREILNHKVDTEYMNNSIKVQLFLYKHSLHRLQCLFVLLYKIIINKR